MQPQSLEQRLERLECENRWMKRVGLMAGVLLVAVVLIGAAVPEEIPEVIEAGAFRAVDKNGETRATMGYNGIQYGYEKGKSSVWMGGLGVIYYDENGKSRAAMTHNGIFYTDENGQHRGVVHSKGFAYIDEKGKTRVALGVFEAEPAAVVLYDAEGKVLWMEP